MTEIARCMVELPAGAEPQPLATLLGGQRSVVVLLRHADCPFCELHVARLVRERASIGRIILIGFTDVDELSDRFSELADDVIVASDPARLMYGLLGAGRGSTWAVALAPRIMARLGWTLATRRTPLMRRGADMHQLGVDAIIEPDGNVTWVHRSRSADDRPAIDDIRAAMSLATAIDRLGAGIDSSAA